MGATEEAEREWLRRIAAGDRSAFERIYRAYHRRVFGYLFRQTNSAESAEELASDVMLEVWKSAGRFRGESQVSTWVLGIARFKALSHLRRPRVESVAVEEAQEVVDPGERQDDTLMKHGLRQGIEAALQQLSEDHREVVELTFFEGLSYPEIATLLECPVNTVKTRMFYARKQLRTLLGAEAAS